MGSAITVMPFGSIVGQEDVKLALELAFIEPKISGVLLSGERGTGKSTAVRAFAQLMFDDLPVTLPINATEDRVVGGWEISELMQSKTVAQKGLLEEADKKLLYVDEINLLDDHIVNILLDVTSTGILDIQRDGRRERKKLAFTLVGTMNPEEGGLRAQLTDRFGLMVSVRKESEEAVRQKILLRVLSLDEGGDSEAKTADDETRVRLSRAKELASSIPYADGVLDACVGLAGLFNIDGHRGEQSLALAARAYAASLAVDSKDVRVEGRHVQRVARLALEHRRRGHANREAEAWGTEDDKRVMEALRGKGLLAS